jgi:Holliday junction resolvase RusA-like endonuclease
MTQRDKWQKRPAVLRYRAFADQLRLCANAAGFTPERLKDADKLDMIVYIPMPASWSAKKKIEMRGQPHRQKIDADNALKAACDALFDEDCRIWDMHVVKRWDDGGGPRLEITV